eukprot:1017989-Alexandrium_andersonii.AAC.1
MCIRDSFISGALGRLPREYAESGFQIKQIQSWRWTQPDQALPEKDEARLEELVRAMEAQPDLPIVVAKGIWERLGFPLPEPVDEFMA